MPSAHVQPMPNQPHQPYDTGMQGHDDPLRRDNRGDTWYRDTWVNNQADQWRQGDVYPQQQPQQYPQQPDQGHQTSSLKRRQQRQFRTPSPQMSLPNPSQHCTELEPKWSQPWDPAIGYPHTVETGYYPATAQTNQQAGGPTVHDRQRAPGIGAVFGNRSLDRSAMFSTQTQRLNGYLTETGRNLSQPSLAINRLVGAATGRRLPQPPPESQPTLGLPMPNTPLPMLQKPVALSTRNRKLPQVPANANLGVGGGPSLTQAQNTMTTSVTKTRPSVRSSRSFHLPFASAFGAGGGNNPTQQQPGHAHGAMSSLSNRTTKSGRGAKLPVVPGSANTAHAHAQPQQHGNTAHGVHAQSQQHGPNTAGGVSSFFGSITGRRKLPDRGTAQSRSLDYPGGPTLETVVEAGRGVRKLPLQPGGATNLGKNRWQNGSTGMMNGNAGMMNGSAGMMNGSAGMMNGNTHQMNQMNDQNLSGMQPQQQQQMQQGPGPMGPAGPMQMGPGQMGQPQPNMQPMGGPPHPMDMVPQGPNMMGPQVGPGQMVGPPGPMGPPMGGPIDQTPMVNGMINANGYLPGPGGPDPNLQIIQQQQPEWT